MLRTTLFRTGGLLLVAGAVMPLFEFSFASYVFSLGALLFAPIQISDRYEGSNLIIRRLRRQQVMGALMLLVTAALMLMRLWDIPPFRGEEWKIALMIATLIEGYTIFRIDKETNKEKHS